MLVILSWVHVYFSTRLVLSEGWSFLFFQPNLGASAGLPYKTHFQVLFDSLLPSFLLAQASTQPVCEGIPQDHEMPWAYLWPILIPPLAYSKH